MQRILGIDPGSLSTGYSVIESNGQTNRYITSGQINTSSLGFGEASGCYLRRRRRYYRNLSTLDDG